MTFGQRLRELREKMGLSISEAATRVGVPKSTYAGYEYDRREPGFDILKIIASKFNTTINYLITGSDREPFHEFTGDEIPDILKKFDVRYIPCFQKLSENKVPPELVQMMAELLVKKHEQEKSKDQ